MNIIINKEYSLSRREIEIGNAEQPKISINMLNGILGVLQLKEIKTIRSYYKNLIESINVSYDIDWQKLFNDSQKKDYLDYIRCSIKENKKYVTRYFLKIFPKRLKLFQNIVQLGDKEVSVYRHSSITGRLSIIAGFNYLIMKKNERKKLTSTIENHTLLELDFNSCEPNFYMRVMDLIDSDEDDMYAFISKKANLKHDLERGKLKRSILAILYGANNNTVKRLSKMNHAQIEKIKNILDIDSFETKLRSEYKEKGFIQNYYGRPILSDANIVNYWIQSSAVDYCCLSFLDFVNNNKDVKLHAVIHDAILFSVPDEKVNDFTSVKRLKCPISNISIPVKININGEDT